MKKCISALAALCFPIWGMAQGYISGDLMMNVNFFQRDTNIKAAGNPLYDNFLSGGEGWLGLRYNGNGFNAVVRFDGFNHSNLQQPNTALTAAGIGMFSLSKEVKDLTITAGHVYDQIGSGILFRAYEDRGLLIDNALFGLHLKYKFSNRFMMKGFTGQSKNLFERYKPIIKGINAEGDFDLGKTVHCTPGIGIVNRTMDQGSMDKVVGTINSLPLPDRFIPVYNSYAATVYNTLNAGDITWYVEGAVKSREAVATLDGLKNVWGNVIYSTLGYARGKFGVNASAKRTENFMMRTSPNESLIRGLYNWQPIIAQIRPQRLIARYTPPSQDLSEIAYTLNGFFTPNDEYTFNLNYTHINSLQKDTLYRELFAEAEIRSVKNIIFHVGAQYLVYNQALYQQKVKEDYPIVHALTPFAEIIYKIDNKRSARTEWQYMRTKQDFGSWVFALFEFNIASRWSFAVSDMYNIAPNYKHVNKAHHYPNFFVARTYGPHRLTLQYVKQVEGINCTGGVCRYEPAFSGVKMSVISTF
ncbi:MAG: hypothetical protein FGM54_01035 [Chitinophagaceae bacterium]|nr:hypothetical protein [Chitinophagaceae bacterium]